MRAAASMALNSLLRRAVELGASDVHIKSAMNVLEPAEPSSPLRSPRLRRLVNQTQHWASQVKVTQSKL